MMLDSYFLTHVPAFASNRQAKSPDDSFHLAVPEYSSYSSGFIRQHHAVDGQ
jgi:hypothetical protein